MLKYILLATCLVQIAYSTFVERQPNCAKGPSYWCQSIATSKECNAFKHCLQTVWSTHLDYLQTDAELEKNVNSANPNPCTNCLQCVDSSINYCPYVHDFTAEVELMRASRLPPTSICKLLEQCKSQQQQRIDDGGLIAEDTTHNHKNDARFKCGYHPREHCDSLEAAKKCSAFSSCLQQWSQQSSVQYVLNPSVDGHLGSADLASEKTCGFCVFLFNKLHSALEQNQTEIDIEQYLLGACALLPTKDEADKCNESVQKFLPEIIQMVRNNLDPGIICRVLKLCDDKYLMPVKVTAAVRQGGETVISDVSDEEKLKINKELREFVDSVTWRVVNPDEAVIETPLSNAHKTETSSLKQSMGVGCELCEIVLSAAEKLIENKVDDQKVLAFIQKELCSRLGNYKQTCIDYVITYGDVILTALHRAAEPSVICEMMGFCLKVQARGERLYDLNVRNTLNCTLCKMVFTEVKKKLSNHDEEEHIINYIDKNLCERVGKQKEVCKSLIQAYGPLFLEIIARDVNPQQLCDLIGMCPARDTSSLPFVDIAPAPAKLKSNETCVMCEFVIKLLSQYITQNATEPEVEKLLDMVCDKLMPKTVQPQCEQFVTQYGPVVVSLIVNGLKSDQVCTYIGLCTKKQQEETRFRDEEHLFKVRSREQARQEVIENAARHKIDEARPTSNQTLQCSLCLYVAELVDDLLKQNKTEAEITHEIELVCNLFPGDLRPECKSFLDEYMPYIIQLIALELDAGNTCSALKLCPKSFERDPLRRSFVN